MVNKTTRYGLWKPRLAQNYNEDVLTNENMDIVEKVIARIDDKGEEVVAQLVTMTNQVEALSNSGVDTIAREQVTNVATQIADISYNAKIHGVKGNGTTDDAPLLNALILLINSLGGGTIFLPKGTYKLLSKLVWKSNVSLVGVGIGKTILKPVDNGVGVGFPAIGFNVADVSSTSPMVNCKFTDFEIDGSGMTNPTYSTNFKGVFIQFMRNCIFKDLYIHDTIATGLGIDFLDKVLISNVTMYNCGRGWTTNGAGGAGIGIGTGGLQSENYIITDCIVDKCGQFGIFIEDRVIFAINPHYTPVGAIISKTLLKTD